MESQVIIDIVTFLRFFKRTFSNEKFWLKKNPFWTIRDVTEGMDNYEIML